MIKYTDTYVQTVARGLCNANEQFIAAGAGSQQSFWTFGIPFFKHSYLLVATSERLIFVDHRRGLVFDRMDKITSYRWSDLGAVTLSGLLSKKLLVKDASNRTLFAMKLPAFLKNPLVNNAANVRLIADTWQQRRALAAAPVYGALPQPAFAPQAYGAPPPPYKAPSTYS